MPRQQLTDVLDALPLGRFHALHLCHACFAYGAMAMCQEVAPYIFDGLTREYGASGFGNGLLAAAFPAGAGAGALLCAWMGDSVGRRPLLLLGAGVSAVFTLLMAGAPSWDALLALRLVQSAAASIILSLFTAWYAEFLPTIGRGPLTASMSLGWPTGRAILIVCAAALGNDWRLLVLATAVPLALLFLVQYAAPESPRHMLVGGDAAGAARVLEQIHATNRTPWAKAEADTLELADPMALASDSEEAPLAGSGARGVAKDAETGGGRVGVLVRRHGALLAFALFLMTALSCTTVLLDVWGPRAFTRLLYGEGTALKYGTLLLFNVGDLIGIVVSIAVVDRIGRRGCFAVGFLLQAALLTTLVLAHSMVETFGAYHCAGGTVQKVEALRGWEHCKDQGAGALALLTFVGMLATGCRCFGWEVRPSPLISTTTLPLTPPPPRRRRSCGSSRRSPRPCAPPPSRWRRPQCASPPSARSPSPEPTLTTSRRRTRCSSSPPSRPPPVSSRSTGCRGRRRAAR